MVLTYAKVRCNSASLRVYFNKFTKDKIEGNIIFNSQQKKLLLLSGLGGILEFYDFIIYALFGGLTPLITMFLIYQFSSAMAPAIYLILISLLCLITLSFYGTNRYDR